MTSAVGQTPPHNSRVRHAVLRRAGGFTLIEILLALAVMLLLAGLTVISFSSWDSSRRLEEASWQFESSLRMARAEAANLGRKVRLEFDDSARPQILWEPEPLTEPGQYVPYEGASWATNLPNLQMVVSHCELTDGSFSWTPPSDQLQSQTQPAALSAITFYPDGSSDSAMIQLRGQDTTEQRTAVLTLDGLNGTITTELLSVSEMVERFGEQAAQNSDTQ